MNHPVRTRQRLVSVSRNAVSRNAVSRPGFTLVETILALGLSSFLLVVIFSLVDSTVGYHVRGNAQLQSSQRLLGLLQDLRTDLRSISSDRRWHEKLHTSTSQESELETQIRSLKQSIGLRELVTPLDLAARAQPIALVGDRQWLLLTLDQPNPRMPITNPGHARTPQSQVLWTSGPEHSWLVATHASGGQMLRRSVTVPAAGSLWRIELGSAGELPGDRPLMIFGQMRVQFRYFDGSHWQVRWNSDQQEALPRAVEISLTADDEAVVRDWIVQLPAAVPVQRDREVRQ